MAGEATDEIDLVQLFVNSIKTLRKHLVLLITCVIVGVLISWGIYTTRPKVFESRMLVYSDILTESYMEKLGKNIERIINEKNFSLLSKRLGLTEDEAKSFVGISVESPLENQPTLEEKGKLFMMLKVEITDNSILPKLQQGLIQYIENNDFVKVRVEQKKKYYTELINKLSVEIEKIEVIKDRVGQGTFKSDGGTYLVEPTNLFLTSISLSKERLEYQQKLELINSMQVVEGFTPFNRKIKPKFSTMLPIGFMGGLFVAFGIIFFRYLITLSNEQ